MMVYGRNQLSFRYTEEERNRALEVSLTSLAARLGFTPVRQGQNYVLKEMDSLVIYNDSSWNRWSGRGNITGGTQIDFLLEFGGVATVPEAIHQLLSFKGEHIQRTSNLSQDRDDRNLSREKSFALPPKNNNYKRLFAYLIKTRGLSAEVVHDFVHQNLIYEDSVHHNIVYCGRDPEGIVRYAGLRGTADMYGKKFKMDVPGNDKNYGVNIVNMESSELKVFESVIDCMSYIDMTGDRTSNKLVLGMVEDNPLEQFLKDYSHIKKISFCLDNDEAGRKAVYGAPDGRKTLGLKEKYMERGYAVTVEVPPFGKDWNESLQNGAVISGKEITTLSRGKEEQELGPDEKSSADNVVEAVLSEAKRRALFTPSEIDFFIDYANHSKDMEDSLRFVANMSHLKAHHPEHMESVISSVYENMKTEIDYPKDNLKPDNREDVSKKVHKCRGR